jgi:hypothetical protein
LPIANKSLYTREVIFSHLTANAATSAHYFDALVQVAFPEPFPGLNFETSKKLFEKEEDNNFVEETLIIQLYSYHLYMLLSNKIENSSFVEKTLNNQIVHLKTAAQNLKSLQVITQNFKSNE